MTTFNELPCVECWTDGSGIATGGPCGYAAILRAVRASTGEVVEKEVVGTLEHGTNNVAEMTAVIEGLRAIRRPSSVVIYTDSEYVKDGFTKWLPGWRERRWRTREGNPVANRALWEDMLRAASPHGLIWNHVKGHARSYLCKCGWLAMKSKGDPRTILCPWCQEPTSKLVPTWPLNERCDRLAGQARRALIERQQPAAGL